MFGVAKEGVQEEWMGFHDSDAFGG